MSILDQIETSLAGFRPRTQAEFAALQLAVMLPSAFVALGMQWTKSPEILKSSASDALVPQGTGRMKVLQVWSVGGM